jgi:type II secretory pathway predicted ATPase ExeA
MVLPDQFHLDAGRRRGIRPTALGDQSRMSPPRLESFCWRVQQLAGEGGFAMVTGVPGSGKSAALRVLSASLATQREVTVGVISRPQANIADYYREMGELFGVELRPHNRFAGAKILRQRWLAHIQTNLCRPVLIVDEAQEMQSAVLAELRLLASTNLDSNILLTTVLAGDGRLPERLRADEFLPLASRMRVRLSIERATPQDLQDCLRHALQQAGAPTLMTSEVIAAICNHAQGNLRVSACARATTWSSVRRTIASPISSTITSPPWARPCFLRCSAGKLSRPSGITLAFTAILPQGVSDL